MQSNVWKWAVKGYAGNCHPRYPLVRHGDLLLSTTHKDDVSKNVEVAAWRRRMARGEVAYVEVINLWEGGTETLYPVDIESMKT